MASACATARDGECRDILFCGGLFREAGDVGETKDTNTWSWHCLMLWAYHSSLCFLSFQKAPGKTYDWPWETGIVQYL